MNIFIKNLTSDIVHSNKVSFGYALAIELVSNIQTILCVIKPAFDFQNVNAGSLITLTGTILGSMIEISSVSYKNQPYLLFGLIAYFLLHFILLALLIIFQIYRNDAKRNKLLRMLAIFYLLHSRVICSLINYLLTQVITSQNNCDKTIENPFLCATAWLALSWAICVLNIGLAFIQEFFFYRITKNKNPYAVKSNAFHQVIFFQKTLVIYLYSLIADTDFKTQIPSFINFISISFASAILYKKLPFYNMSILKETAITTTIALTTAFISILRVFGLSKDGLEVAWIFLTFFVMKIYFACLNRLFSKIMQGNFDSPEKVIHFIILIKRSKFGYTPPLFFKRKLPLKALLINGALLNNKVDITNIKSSKTKEDYEKNFYQQIILHLERIMDHYPKSELLLLFMAQIYLKKLKNIPKTIALIKKFEDLSLPLWAHNSLQDFKSKLKRVYSKEYLFNSNKEILNLMIYFDSRAHASLIKENMLKEVERHLEFWEEIKKESVDVKAVAMLARRIDSFSKAVIQKQQQHDDHVGTYFANFLVLFAMYLNTIQENPQDAKKFIFRFTNFHNHLDQSFDVKFDKEAVIVVPIEKDGFGRVIDASGSAQALFRTSKQNIINKPLSFLLPSVTPCYLFKMINNCLEATERLNLKYPTYGKTNKGTMFEVEVELMLYPQLEKEIKVIMLFRKVTSSRQVIMIDSNGSIVECSEKLQRKLNFPKTGTRPVYLQEILNDFSNINTIFKFAPPLDKQGNEDRLPSSRFFKSMKTINYFSTGFTKQNLITIDEISKNEPDDSPIRASPNKTDSPEPNDKSNSNNAPTRPLSINQTEVKTMNLERTEYALKFVPLCSSDATISYTYNVEIKPYLVDQETYKVLTLINTTTNIELQGFSKESRLTINESIQNKYEEVSFDDVPEERVYMNKVQNAKRISNAKEETIKNNISAQISPKSDHLSPKSSFPLVVKHGKNQVFTPLGTKRTYSRGRRESSIRERLTERETSISSTSSSSLLSIKALRSLFSDPSHSPLKKTSLLIYLLIIFMGCLGGVNLYFSQRSLEQIDTGIMIVNFATLRLSESMRGWQVAIRFYIRYLKLRAGSIQLLKTTIMQKGLGMVQMSNRLSQEVSSQVRTDLLEEIYRKDVELWDLYQNKKFTNDKVDTFVATKFLGSKMVYVGNTTLDYETPVILEEIRYLVNNTANDFLLSSEKLVSVTQNMLQSIISDNISTLQIMLGAETLALVILCLALVFSAKIVLTAYHTLFRALAKIDNHQIENRIGLLQRLKQILAQDIETRQFSVEAMNFLNMPNDGNAKYQIDSHFRSRKMKLNTIGLRLHLIKVIAISLLVIQTITCLFISSLSQSIYNFQALEKVNNQLYVTTRAGIRVTMIVGVFYTETSFRNQTTMLIRKEAPSVQVVKTLNELKQVNNDLLSVFYEPGIGVTDPFIKELLEERICKYLTKDIQTSCKSVAQTPDKDLGLLHFNLKLLQLEEYFIDLYFSNPTYLNAKSFVEIYAATMRPTVDTLDQAYDILNNYIIQTFREQKDVYLAKTTYFYLGILASLLFSLLVIEGISIKKLRSLDLCRGLILKTISCKILLENKTMKFYLSKNFTTKIT